MKISEELISDVSFNTGIAASYIEKDWYLIKVLDKITKLNTDDVKIVFAGGTSLSKAYSYTKRFSEDIDFDIVGLSEASRKERGNFRDKLIDLIDSIEYLKVEESSVFSRDENRFTNFYVEYPKNFKPDSTLRNNLKIELSFKDIYMPTERKQIGSYIGEYVKDAPVADIDCLSVVETAANKFNALLWRIDIKDRTQPYNHMTNDPALMRHLYDLSALYPVLTGNNQFVSLVKEIYKQDCTRGDKTRHLTIVAFCDKTLEKLETDADYKKEYEMFVSKMIYRADSRIPFDVALDNYKKLIKSVNG